MKKVLLTILLMSICSYSCAKKSTDKIIVAYVTSGENPLPDPMYMTHINYAFGHVNETFNGIVIQNPERLKQIVALKKQKPDLKVLLSIGGWTSGRFSEMAADPVCRAGFVADCKRIIDEFGLDGVDLDWEYPTSSAAGISSSPDDTENYTKMMQEIRKKIGKKKLLTLASDKSARYIDFRAIDPYIDFVNIMAYDMAKTPKHHSGMFRSEMTGKYSCEEAIQAHLDAGIPMNKLVFGMPFYGHGLDGVLPYYVNFYDIPKLEGLTDKWDEVAKAPYMEDSTGRVVLNYENARSIGIKCRYIHEKGMLGAMYWEYATDDEMGTLRKAVFEGVYPDKATK